MGKNSKGFANQPEHGSAGIVKPISAVKIGSAKINIGAVSCRWIAIGLSSLPICISKRLTSSGPFPPIIITTRCPIRVIDIQF